MQLQDLGDFLLTDIGPEEDGIAYTSRPAGRFRVPEISSGGRGKKRLLHNADGTLCWRHRFEIWFLPQKKKLG